MKAQPQRTADLTQLCNLIEDIPIALWINRDDDSTIVSRPMAPLEMDRDGSIWFFTDKRSTKVEHLQTVNVSFADTSKSIYVSMTGKADMLTDRARIDELWTPFARPWFPEGPESPDLALLKFTPHTAQYWDSPHSKVVRMFAIAASIVAHKPVGLGENATLTGLAQ